MRPAVPAAQAEAAVMKKVVVADARKCYACLACVLECAYHKAGAPSDAPPSAELLSRANLFIEGIEGQAVPILCHHCEDAPCMTVCPSGAISRSDPEAPVTVNPARCIGCKACVMACPFGVMRMTHDGRAAVKCDLCLDRTQVGELPRCVASCRSRALSLKTLDEVEREARRRAARAIVQSGE
jgi:carbon-monoxide dehydrogenase iron sulfur subunit